MTITRPIISAKEVKQMMIEKQSSTIIIDARGGADALARYQAGHLKGAIFMDLEQDLSVRPADPANGGRHPLPTPQAFGDRLGRAGISPDAHVLVYDDKAGANAAARFWWMMRAAGHENVQVIDGGLEQLRLAGLTIEKGDGVSGQPTSPYPARAWQLPTVGIAEVDKLRAQNAFLIIDVREAYRYRGENEPIDLVAGHIPGAVNVPYLDNLNPDGTFRSSADLQAHYESIIGDRSGENLIVHCGSGVTACHTLLALASAGIGASLYVGSWSEWSRNEKPRATGPNP